MRRHPVLLAPWDRNEGSNCYVPATNLIHHFAPWRGGACLITRKPRARTAIVRCRPQEGADGLYRAYRPWARSDETRIETGDPV